MDHHSGLKQAEDFKRSEGGKGGYRGEEEGRKGSPALPSEVHAVFLRFWARSPQFDPMSFRYVSLALHVRC